MQPSPRILTPREVGRQTAAYLEESDRRRRMIRGQEAANAAALAVTALTGGADDGAGPAELIAAQNRAMIQNPDFLESWKNADLPLYWRKYRGNWTVSTAGNNGTVKAATSTWAGTGPKYLLAFTGYTPSQGPDVCQEVTLRETPPSSGALGLVFFGSVNGADEFSGIVVELADGKIEVWQYDDDIPTTVDMVALGLTAGNVVKVFSNSGGFGIDIYIDGTGPFSVATGTYDTGFCGLVSLSSSAAAAQGMGAWTMRDTLN